MSDVTSLTLDLNRRSDGGYRVQVDSNEKVVRTTVDLLIAIEWQECNCFVEMRGESRQVDHLNLVDAFDVLIGGGSMTKAWNVAIKGRQEVDWGNPVVDLLGDDSGRIQAWPVR